MKSKKLKLIIVLLVSIIIAIATVFSMTKNKVELVLLDNDLNYQAFTLVSKQSLLSRVDLEKSSFENLNIYISNDDFDEYDIDKDLNEIYKSFDLALKNADYIPVGKNIKLRYSAISKDLIKEEIVEMTLDFNPIIKIYDYQEKLVDEKSSYIVTSNADLNNLLNFKGYINKFDDQIEEINLSLSNNIDVKKNDNYQLTIKNNLYDYEKQVEVIVKVPEVIKVEKKPIISEETTKPKPIIISDTSLIRIDVLINKQNSLSANAIPPLQGFPSGYALSANYLAQPQAVEGFIHLADTMKAETKMTVVVTSAYRSYNYQNDLFNRYVNRDGLQAAQRYSARPGQSEHQSGLALDISKPNVSILNFDGTQEAIWVAANAHRFGFIIRYPQGKEAITGYMYEPWHLRFLGIELATLVKNSNLTYDEYHALYIDWHSLTFI